MVTGKPPAFVSYSRDDSAFTLKLAADLKERGAKIWLDQLDIRAGQPWDREVERAVAACSDLIVILSPSSVNSVNVMDEVAYALDEHKNVIPVYYLDCNIPLRLRRLQYIDFREKYESAINIMWRTLESGDLTVPLAAVTAAAAGPREDSIKPAAPAPDTKERERLSAEKVERDKEQTARLKLQEYLRQERAAEEAARANHQSVAVAAAQTQRGGGWKVGAAAAVVVAVAIGGLFLIRSNRTNKPPASATTSQQSVTQQPVLPLPNSPRREPEESVPQPKTTERIVVVDPAVANSNLISMVKPVYSDVAKAAHAQGTVVLKIEISKSGTVESARLINSVNPLLVAPAIEAVKQWVYKPYVVNGRAVPVQTDVIVRFDLKF